MNDQEVRQLIRESIARLADSNRAPTVPAELIRAAHGPSPAFVKFPFLRSGDDDGACVIEPSVRCNHCGYCLSYGH